MELPVFQFVSMPLVLELGTSFLPSSILLAPSLHALIHIEETPEAPLLKAEQSQLSQPFLKGEQCREHCSNGYSGSPPLVQAFTSVTRRLLFITGENA